MVLDFAQSFVGGMTQIAVVCPTPELHLRDRGWLREYQVLPLPLHRRFFIFTLFERCVKLDGVFFLETGAN